MLKAMCLRRSRIRRNGGKLTLLDDAGTEVVEIFQSNSNIIINNPTDQAIKIQRAGSNVFAMFGTNNMYQDLDMRGNIITNVSEGTGASDPTTDAPDGWMVYETQAGNTRYIPFYT